MYALSLPVAAVLFPLQMLDLALKLVIHLLEEAIFVLHRYPSQVTTDAVPAQTEADHAAVQDSQRQY